MKTRTARIKRATRETRIDITLALDGRGRPDVDTGLPFLNHMLELFSRHALMDLRLRARGDLAVDYHHTVEDLGLCLGQALDKALGDLLADRGGHIEIGRGPQVEGLPQNPPLASIPAPPSLDGF